MRASSLFYTAHEPHRLPGTASQEGGGDPAYKCEEDAQELTEMAERLMRQWIGEEDLATTVGIEEASWKETLANVCKEVYVPLPFCVFPLFFVRTRPVLSASLALTNVLPPFARVTFFYLPFHHHHHHHHRKSDSRDCRVGPHHHTRTHTRTQNRTRATPHSTLPQTSALLGGMVAQEAIKLITRQYVPLGATCVWDGIRSGTGIVDA